MLTPPPSSSTCFFFNDTATTEIYTLSLHDALPIFWTGDAFTTTVFSIDRTTLAADPTPPVPVDCAKTVFNYVADVMTIGGDVYALCGSNNSGELYRLDPDTGAVKAHVTVGPNPTELRGLDDRRIAVVNAGDSTISLVTPSGGGPTPPKGITPSPPPGPHGVRAVWHPP